MRKAIAVLVVLCVAAQAVAQVQQLDLSGSFNYDAYITWAEKNHADSYSPPGDWGLGTRYVWDVFGEHDGWWHETRGPTWQDDVFLDGEVGIPTNGVITTGYGTFQLSTARDAEPVGGYVQAPLGTDPKTVLPRADNSLYFNAKVSDFGISATVSATLEPGQQQQYSSINFLFTGRNDEEVNIYANYESEGAGTSGTLIWDSPLGTGLPYLRDNTSNDPDIEQAFYMTRTWAESGGVSVPRPGGTYDGRLWTFVDPLGLDPDKVLVGFTFEGTDTFSRGWVYAASADVVPEPGTMALLGLGLGGLVLRRRRK